MYNNDLKNVRDKTREYYKGQLQALSEQYAHKRSYEEWIYGQIDKLKNRKQSHVDFPVYLQDEPYTCVQLLVHVHGKNIQSTGFTQAWGRDLFDPDEGYRIATKKAVRRAARKLVGLDDG